MIKVRRSVLVVTAAAVVVGVAAFALTHTHQSMEVITGTESSSNIASINIGPDKFSSSDNQIASHIVPQKGVIPPGKIIKEPGNTNKPKPKSVIDKFAEYKSKYGLLTIPTYDGSNQLTHPKVLYFANGWHGYHYWMSMTPYPYTMDRYENPSIVVSNDGEKWVVPIGLKNPISGLPVDVKIGGHYSDPHLVMRDNVIINKMGYVIYDAYYNDK